MLPVWNSGWANSGSTHKHRGYRPSWSRHKGAKVSPLGGCRLTFSHHIHSLFNLESHMVVATVPSTHFQVPSLAVSIKPIQAFWLDFSHLLTTAWLTQDEKPRLNCCHGEQRVLLYSGRLFDWPVLLGCPQPADLLPDWRSTLCSGSRFWSKLRCSNSRCQISSTCLHKPCLWRATITQRHTTSVQLLDELRLGEITVLFLTRSIFFWSWSFTLTTLL